jgi:predicted dehydrogenase
MRIGSLVATTLLAIALAVPAFAQTPKAGQIRVGIIGIDAHAVPWTKTINDPKAPTPISDMRIVAAYPSFSPDVEFSAKNIQKNTELMRSMGVEIVDSIAALMPKVDAVMVLSIDGRPHLEQAKAVIAAHKMLYVDKPVADSLVNTIRIYELAKKGGVPCFSSSSLRYSADFINVQKDPKIGKIRGCDAYGNNVSILPNHPDLFYYGVHGCETLFTIMGPGCKTVTRVAGGTADMAVGVWKDGRVGTFRGILQGQRGFGAVVYGEKGIGPAGKFEGYTPLIVEIAKYFKTGKPPLAEAVTLEIYAFMEGADESKRQGGRPVELETVLAKARQQAAAK